MSSRWTDDTTTPPEVAAAMATPAVSEPSNNSPTSARRPAPRAGSPWESKKRRKVRTCTECRRRKLQCDLATPTCGRCVRAIRAGQPAVCRYLDDANPTPLHNLVTSTDDDADIPQASDAATAVDGPPDAEPYDSILAKLDRQNQRIEELERALSQVSQSCTWSSQIASAPMTPESVQSNTHAGASSIARPDIDSTLLKGSSFKTRFYGLSFPESIIAYTSKLSDLSKEIVSKFPILLKVRQDLREYESRSSPAETGHQSSVRTDLLSLLPSREDTDALVGLYLDNYDQIYHIVHLPTFWAGYSKMWSNLSTSDPHFVVLVLLMASIAQCLQNKGVRQYAAKRSAAREAAINTVQACEDWLAAQRRKHTSILDFQVRFLVCLAKTVNGTKFKRAWVDVGMLLRYCMAAGLHKDPDSLTGSKPTSSVDKEMRRRVWTAVADLELQASFTRGMMSAPWPSCSDYIAPSNVTDEDIGLGEHAQPASTSLADFCPSSYLVAATASLTLRYSLNSLLNDVRQTITFDMAKHYTEQIEFHLERIPQWSARAAQAPRALLCVNLYNCMLVLHDRHIRQTTSKLERKFSQVIITDVLSRMVALYRSLMEADCHAIQLLCHDHLRAVLSACHAITVVKPASGEKVDDSLLDTASEVAACTVEMLMEKVERLGGGQQQLWIALVANALIKCEKDAGDKALHMQEAVDRMIGSYYKILACQDSQSLATPRPLEFPSGNEMEVAVSTAGRFPPFDLDAMSAWTFDEWSFDLPEELNVHGEG